MRKGESKQKLLIFLVPFNYARGLLGGADIVQKLIEKPSAQILVGVFFFDQFFEIIAHHSS